MEFSSYDDYLRRPCNMEEIVRMSNVVFIEGHLDRLDDLILVILPLANIVYYNSIRYLDDREYAKEDLISEAILRLYQDMLLRWDKYIHVDRYCDYYSTILRNTMIGLVHVHHNYYMSTEYDPDVLGKESCTNDTYDDVEVRLLKEETQKNIIELAEKLLSYRAVNTKLLISILKCKYVDKAGLDSLKSRVRVVGISSGLFDFYCEHVDYIYKLSYNYQYAIIGDKKKMITRISSTIDRFEDVTYKMLSAEYYDSIIPELYAEFGADVAKRFVKTFSNRTIQVPSYRDFCDSLLGGIVLTLASGDKTNLYQVAEEYQLPYRSLARIYNKALKFEQGK